MYFPTFLTICFFFSSRRRHTRWPRDWSSDVCSSDLCAFHACSRRRITHEVLSSLLWSLAQVGYQRGAVHSKRRSEERRVGKECRSRRSLDQEKKNKR